MCLKSNRSQNHWSSFADAIRSQWFIVNAVLYTLFTWLTWWVSAKAHHALHIHMTTNTKRFWPETGFTLLLLVGTSNSDRRVWTWVCNKVVIIAICYRNKLPMLYPDKNWTPKINKLHKNKLITLIYTISSIQTIFIINPYQSADCRHHYAETVPLYHRINKCQTFTKMSCLCLLGLSLQFLIAINITFHRLNDV